MDSAPAGPPREGALPGPEPAAFPLDAVLRQLPAGVAVARAPDGRLVQVNPRLEELWRRPLGEVSGVEEYGVWGGQHADGRPYRPEEWPLARSLASGEVVEDEDVRIVRGDGSRAVARLCSSPIRDGSGTIVGAVLTASDVTEQEGRRRVRRLLAEASAVLASSLDYEATLRSVARLIVPTLADWCSVDVVREGREVERLALEHPGSGDADARRETTLRELRAPATDERMLRVLRDGASELIPELDAAQLRALVHDDEQLRLLRAMEPRSAMIVPLVARGEILGALVLVGARSRRRYGPGELEQIQELAVRAALAIDSSRLHHDAQAGSRAKTDFLAVISHELRTPLTAIIGFAELLSMGVPEAVTERQREQVERIEVSARHLLQLIEEVLTMANLETGPARVARERVEVRELVERAMAITRPLAAAKGLEIGADPVEPGLAAETDPDRLLQVLLSLLSNAVKFTEGGEIRISARADGEFLEVAVRDTGIGVEPGHRERIFDPFWQAEQPITRRAGGTGLGLAISRRVMQLLGGELRLEGSPGPGSAFVIRLPIG